MEEKKYADCERQLFKDIEEFFKKGADRIHAQLNLLKQGYLDEYDKKLNRSLGNLPKEVIQNELEQITFDVEFMAQSHKKFKEMYDQENGDFLKYQMLTKNIKRILEGNK